MLQRRADGQGGRGVPEPGGPVAACRREQGAVRREGEAGDLLAVRHRLADRVAALGVPEPGRAVPADRRDHHSRRAELDEA